MAKNRKIEFSYSPQTEKFPNNKPTNVKGGKNGKENLILDNSGNYVSPLRSPIRPPIIIQSPIEGEIIELKKRHYDQTSTSELLDRGFIEITKTKENLNPTQFFNLYQELFYDIPKQGKRSHTFLIEESTKYIGGYEDPKDDKINTLIDKLTEIEGAQLQNPGEHPLFRNGIAIKAGNKLGIMQEGHLRLVSDSGDPSPFDQLKKALGIVNPSNGKPLQGEDSWTKVSEQTWDSLPKWPTPDSDINESADWSMTLAQFTLAASNITILNENIKSSELDQAEINFLINELNKKVPFTGITIEDESDGTIEYTVADLAPIGFVPEQGSNNIATFYKGGMFGEARTLYPRPLANQIIAKYEARASKGIYGLGNNIYGADGANESIGHLSEGEKAIEKERQSRQSLQSAILNPLSIYNQLNPFVPSGTNFGTDRHEFRKDWHSETVNDLEDLIEELASGQFVRYRWQLDPIKSFDQSLFEGGIPLNNGRRYWVEYEPTFYSNYYIKETQKLIDDHIAFYSNHSRLSALEDNS